MKAALLFRWNAKTNKSLPELDPLYDATISQLPVLTQIHYCENLIAQSQLDLKLAVKKKEKVEIQQRIKAAELQLERLR